MSSRTAFAFVYKYLLTISRSANAHQPQLTSPGHGPRPSRTIWSPLVSAGAAPCRITTSSRHRSSEPHTGASPHSPPAGCPRFVMHMAADDGSIFWRNLENEIEGRGGRPLFAPPLTVLLSAGNRAVSVPAPGLPGADLSPTSHP